MEHLKRILPNVVDIMSGHLYWCSDSILAREYCRVLIGKNQIYQLAHERPLNLEWSYFCYIRYSLIILRNVPEFLFVDTRLSIDMFTIPHSIYNTYKLCKMNHLGNLRVETTVHNLVEVVPNLAIVSVVYGDICTFREFAKTMTPSTALRLFRLVLQNNRLNFIKEFENLEYFTKIIPEECCNYIYSRQLEDKLYQWNSLRHYTSRAIDLDFPTTTQTIGNYVSFKYTYPNGSSIITGYNICESDEEVHSFDLQHIKSERAYLECFLHQNMKKIGRRFACNDVELPYVYLTQDSKTYIKYLKHIKGKSISHFEKLKIQLLSIYQNL